MTHAVVGLSTLQRADWRFLLPNVGIRRSVCFAPGRLADSVRLISSEMCSPDRPAWGACDLAVAVDPDRATLQAAAAALEPGGWCYSEWYSPWAGGTHGIRRRLTNAGLNDIAFYSPWPAPAAARTRMWVPLEAPGALTYFLRSRRTPRGFSARLARSLARQGWGVAARAGLVFPLCALARKPVGQPTRSPNAPALLGPPMHLLRTNWMDWGFGPTPDRLSWLVLTVGVRLENKVVGLVFAEPDPSLRVIVKMVRVPSEGQRLTHEAAVLRALATLQPGGVPGVPRLLFCEPSGSGPAVAETALEGKRLFTWVRPDNAAALARTVTDWLIRLVRRDRVSAPAAWWPRLVEPILSAFQALYGAVIDPSLLAEAIRRLRLLGPMPSTIEHRDFGWWNMLVTADNQICVLDWETSETDGLPALDLFYFLYFVAALLDGSDRDRGFRETHRRYLDPTSPTGRIATECVARYVEGAGIQPEAVPALRLLTWMLQAISDHRDLTDRAGGAPSIDALRNGLYFALWEAELRYAEPA